MKKEQIIGIILITLVVFIYMTYLTPKYYGDDTTKKGTKTTTAATTDTTAQTPANTVTPVTGVQSTTAVSTTVPAVNLADAKDIVVDTDLYRARFTTLGGRLKSMKLKTINTLNLPSVPELEEELKAAKDANNYNRIAYTGYRLTLAKELVILKKNEEEARKAGDKVQADQLADQIKEAQWVDLNNSPSDLPMALQLELAGMANAELQTLYTASTDTLKLSSQLTTATLVLSGKLPNGLEIQKTITFFNNGYHLPMEIRFNNPTDKAMRYADASGSGAKLYAGSGLGDMQVFAPTSYDLPVQPSAKVNNKVKPIKISAKQMELREGGSIAWAGLETHYFFKGYVPQPNTSLVTTVGAKYSSTPGLYIPSLWMEIPSFDLPSKYESKQSFVFYAGPKQVETLNALGVPVKQLLFPGWLESINIIILITLKWFYGLVHNYGLAIILISILLKIVTFPLTHISYKSMRKMQLIAPEMKALQEKFKDDPARQQKEIMGLYQKHKVNPMSGCLPLLIQMPIFIALYQVLGKVVELRGAPFFWWITDLSRPDTIGHIPGLGIAINILPILMGVTMWVQQKMTTTPDPKSAMMSQFMTIFFIFIFWNMPSGLVLYWFITNILSIAQQHYINKQDIPLHIHTIETKNLAK